MINPDELINRIERLLETDKLNERLSLRGEYLVSVGQGDLLPIAVPFPKFPWLEAMIGCPIRMTEGHLWVDKYVGDPSEIEFMRSEFEHSPWFELYIYMLEKLQDRLSGNFFVSASTNLRGPSDISAALMGVENAAIGWLDKPEVMKQLMRACTEAVLTVVEAGNRILERQENGYACKWGLWNSEKIVANQADHSSLVSPQIYKKQILPYDAEIIRSSPISIMHLHNNGLHQVPALLELSELDAIQVWMDPYPESERREYEIEVLKRILEDKSLVLDVYMPNIEEYERLLEQLPKKGLFYKAWFDSDQYDSLPENFPGTDLWLLD